MRHLWVTVAVWMWVGGTARAQLPPEEPVEPEPVDVPAAEVELTQEIDDAPQAPEDEELLALSRLSLSGYLQAEARYEVDGDEDDLFYFQVRRGRLKFDYDLSPAEFLIQIDATEDGVDVKDAYASLALPVPEGMDLVLMAGLFQIPFGFDLQHSSSRRVFPERSQMVRLLFPGERDLGVRLDGSFADEMIEVQLAVQNGVPRGDAFFGEFGVADGNAMKDITGRVALALGHATFGVSGLYGEGTNLIPDDPATPMVDESDEFDFPRWAVGAELRYQRDLGFGALDLYGEISYSQNLLRKRAAFYPADQDAEVNAVAWYLAAVQGLGEHFALGLRFDQVALEDADAINILTPVAMATPHDDVRIVLAYDFHVYEGGSGNNEGWLRMQVKF